MLIKVRYNFTPSFLLMRNIFFLSFSVSCTCVLLSLSRSRLSLNLTLSPLSRSHLSPSDRSSAGSDFVPYIVALCRKSYSKPSRSSLSPSPLSIRKRFPLNRLYDALHCSSVYPRTYHSFIHLWAPEIGGDFGPLGHNPNRGLCETPNSPIYKI